MRKDTKLPEALTSTLAAAILGVSSPAMAATIQVTSMGSSVDPSDNVTTLREAIKQANASAGTDVITFQSELSGTINTGGPASLPYIYDSLVILGDNRITLNANGDESILEARYIGAIPAPPAPEVEKQSSQPTTSAATVASPKGNLTVSGLTLTGAEGAAIYAVGYGGGTLTVDDSSMTGNGAAIYAAGIYQNTFVRDSVISGNAAISEGSDTATITQYAEHGSSNLTVFNSTIRNNQSAYGAVALVASTEGVGESGSNLLVEDSTISGNTGSASGGITAYGADAAVNNSVIRGNQVTGSEESAGGGISLIGSDAQITASRLENNSAGLGGGIAGKYSSLELRSVEITGNTASNGPGGGIFLAPTPYSEGAQLQVSSSLIQGNSAIDSGGGIFTSFTEGSAESSASANIESTVIRENQTQESGGGLYMEVGSNFDGGNVSISGSTLADNSAEFDGAGLLFSSDSVPLSVSNSRITGNSTADGSGGGMALGLNSDSPYASTVSGSVVSGNTAQDFGGGVYASIDDTNELRFEDTRLSGNTAYDDGGAIHTRAMDTGATAVAGTLTTERSTLDDNYAGYLGGAISASGYYDANVAVVNTTISGNTAGTGAGALYLATDSTSASSGGSAMLNGATVYANTITTAEGSGANRAQVYLNGQAVSATVDHTVISGNSTGSSIAVARTEEGTAVGADFSLLASVDAINSGNSDLDPKSTSLEGTAVNPGPLQDNGGITPTHLPAAGGPLNDGGDTSVPGALDDEDQRGFPRLDGTPPVNGNTDIGAVELQDFDGDGVIDNLPPEFTGNLPAALRGRVGRTVDINVLDFVTDDNSVLSAGDVAFEGLPTGLSYSGGRISGELERSGTFLVRATATDGQGASTSIQEEVEVREAESGESIVVGDDDEDFLGGITPQWLLILAGLLGLGRRRR